jgi:hypothetical protein
MIASGRGERIRQAREFQVLTQVELVNTPKHKPPDRTSNSPVTVGDGHVRLDIMS